MIIDKQGKLFGKINLLDVCIALLVLCFLAVGAISIFSSVLGSSSGSAVETEVTYTLEITKQKTEIMEKINVGDMVYDAESKALVGEVVGCEIKPARYVSENRRDLRFEVTEVEGRSDAKIKIKTTAVFNYPDFLIGNETIKIGAEVERQTQDVMLKGYIVDLEYDKELVEGQK